MRITTKRAKKASKPVTVRLDDRALAIARAEARAAGMSLSGHLAKVIQAAAGQRPEQALQEDIQQVGQASMLSAQLATEALAHLQIMLMPSPTQKQQIESRRAQLYSQHFSPAEPEQAPAGNSDSQGENGTHEINEVTEAEL